VRDPEEATDGPPDPRTHPEQSPGFGESPEGLEDIEVSRDITIGDATPRELQATDLTPVAGASAAEKIEDLLNGDHVERRRAALALGEERPEEAVLDAVIAATNDPDDDVRQFAVESLAELGGERAAAAVVETLDDDDPWVRAEAVVALDNLDRIEFEDHIEAALDDDHHAVRRNAAISLFKHRGEDLLPVLLEQSRADSERLREWAAHLMAGIEDERATDRLTELAEDDDEPRIVRSTAARAVEADPGKFRRQFTGGIEGESTALPGEDRLNRRPDL
jgi:HEAT repeat protein